MLQLLAIKLISGKLRMRHLVKLCSEKMFTLDSVDALQVLVNTRSGFESENNLLKKVNIIAVDSYLPLNTFFYIQ